MQPKKQSSQANSTPKKRGRKKWLNKDLTFKVDPQKSKLFSKGKTSNLIPYNKKLKKKPYKIIYCDRKTGVGLLKSSRICFSKRVA